MARGKRPKAPGAGGGDPDAGDGPSVEALRASIIERVQTMDSRNTLLAVDAVVSLSEPPLDLELSVEAFLGVAEMVAGVQYLTDQRRRAREERGAPS